MTRWLAVAIVVVAVLSAGCSGPGTVPTRETHSEPSTSGTPQGRDEKRVIDALRRLDMCAVLQAAVGVGRDLRAYRPSECVTFDAAPEVDLRVARLAADRRTSMTAKNVGGAKAYVQGSSSQCLVQLPVSADLVIVFSSDDTCAKLEPIAAEAVSVLSRPALLEGEPRWDACTVLRKAPDVDPGADENLDLCTDKKTLANVEFSYTTPGVPEEGWRRSTVDGVEVWTLDDRDPDAPSCTAEWSLGPAPSDHADGELVASVGAIDCAKVTPLVAPLVAALKKKPDAGDPQRPLLYAPGEPDHP
jgi:hypothetical protein